MGLQEWEYSYIALPTTRHLLSCPSSKQLSTNLAYLQELGLIRVEKTWKWQDLCYIIHSEAQIGEAILQGEVSITSVLSAYDVTYSLAVLLYFTICSIIWKLLGFWNQITKCIWWPFIVFLPRINCHLQTFEAGHNSGPISTEHNSSPEQLWIRGMLAIRNADLRVAQELGDEVCFKAMLLSLHVPLHCCSK